MHPEPFTQEERIQSSHEFALRLLAKQPTRYDPSRLASALALVLDTAKYQARIAKYETTIWRCLCPDYAYRGIACKHMLARMLGSGIFA